MDFSVSLFASKLKEWFVNSALFPYYEIANTKETQYGRSKQYDDKSKHPNRNPTHLKDVAKQCLESSTYIEENKVEFDYGNAVMEANYPHYHILEDSQIIRKRMQGTKKTKGSQDNVQDKAKRDYGKVSWNGKTFTKEYDRNVRGSRNRMKDVSHWGIVNGQSKWENPESNSYYNVHYKYIENILDQDVVMRLEAYFGLKKARKIDTGLNEEYGLQEESNYTTNIFDILNTHDIGE